ncbi:MAG: hypothetical protein COU08_04060 [Candidatus Harrisonbacteria bacterium CG10_big_fil_rev_8_21_14_0_10_42_17]|uniref:Uncharacterized protein n=1 Tax=Candidatus Harrisonbacteria bacterium CG10_big_fil_rev_8_21_14_0_10_42_17 TaxID=1974584 RepID=A0A2M6WH90_9BACT|nr:MAG: hypothetical protein COU08_04060 [Candidatus Harrisonbacteria bacterium CG10_big_fil_rev_8_21_14_0_10_42_17]
MQGVHEQSPFVRKKLQENHREIEEVLMIVPFQKKIVEGTYTIVNIQISIISWLLKNVNILR